MPSYLGRLWQGWLTLGLLAFVIVAGVVRVHLAGQYEDKTARVRLLERTSTAAAAIHPKRIVSLSGAETDLSSPDYARIKEQLAKLRQAVGDIRFYYLLRLVDGKIIFLCDSEPPESKDYSPPGQVYDEAAPEFRTAFDKAQSAIVGPWTDRWGDWVSGVVPIRGEEGKVIAVLGADIEANHWRQALVRARLAPTVITLLTSGLLILLYIMQKRERTAKNAISRMAAEQSLLLDTIETQVWHLQDTATYGAVNKAHAAFLGLPKSALERRALAEAPVSSNTRAWIRGNPEVFETQHPIRTEEWAVDARQQIRSLAITRTPKLNPEGAVEYVVCSAEDITDRKRAEGALRESHTFYQQLINSAYDGIFVCNKTGHYVLWNPAMERIRGLRAEDVIGKHPRDLFPFLGAQGVIDLFERAMTGEFVATPDYLYTFPDGKDTAWATSEYVPLRDATGAVIGVIGTVRDVTERRKAQEERLRLEGQLAQAQKMESIGRLAGGVAHDFNNVLSVILGYGELITKDLAPDSPLRADVEEIVAAAERAKDLTGQLLAFSRKQVLDFKILDPAEVILGIEKMLRRLLGEDIAIEMSIRPGIGLVNADRSQLEQTLLNLCVNARDAMPEGGTLTIETAAVHLDEHYALSHPGVQPGPYILLSVSDTGCGMDEETRSQIFDPFFSTKEKGKGTGLGLATVFGIVKQHGGEIWVYSELGEGTTFKVYLPKVQGVVSRDEDEQTAPVIRGEGETILVVEDEDAVRTLACQMLSRLGYNVLESHNPEECLKYVKREPHIDLLLTDVIMPHMNGRQICEQVAALAPDIAVLFMSGYTADVIAQHGVLDESIHFISKPFTEKALSRKIREVLDGRGEAGANPGPEAVAKNS